MRLENSFTVEAAPDAVWAAMLDFERVAGCVPGSEVVGQTDDGGFEASTRVKVGPMSMTYRGVVAIVEQDDGSRRAVMRARARETRGQGTATAQMVMAVHEETPVRVTIDTDVDVTGRVAQMGRGVMQDVAGRIVDQFAENFRALLAAGAAGGEAGAPEPAAPAPARAAPEPAGSLSAWGLLRAIVGGRLRAAWAWLRRLRGGRR